MKRILRLLDALEAGRPFTGAWIETSCQSRAQSSMRGSPLHGGVD